MDMRDEIRERFGARVEEIVLGCTDSDRRLDEDSWTRKMKAVAHLSDASPEVLRVSLADKLHNARSILRDLEQVGAAVWQRFNVGREIVHRGEKVSVSWRQARNCLELLTAVADAVDLLAEGAMAP